MKHSLTNAPEPVWLHPSVWSAASALARRDALFASAIPNSLHYETPRQSQLWQAVARLYAPEVEPVYREIFEPVLDWASDGDPIHVIGLGAGGARKEAWLIENLYGARFTPVDISGTLALLSAQHVMPLVPEKPRPVVADLLEFPDLADWLDTWDGRRAPRLYTAFGLTPNSLPSQLLPILRGYLRPRDQLLVSANLMPDGQINRVLPEYGNLETLAWISQILTDWGLREKLTEPRFRVGALEEQAAIVAESQWKDDVRFPWENSLFSAEAGKPLRLFFSLRFTPESFAALLTAHGFQILAAATSDCEGVWLVNCP